MFADSYAQLVIMASNSKPPELRIPAEGCQIYFFGPSCGNN
jgi:hypothetical protein